MPASLMTRSEPRPRRKRGSSRAAREAHEAAQLEQVVDLGEEVGRAADAHRREARQRLVARRLDADAALDVGAQRAGPRRRSGGAAAEVAVTAAPATIALDGVVRRQRLAARRGPGAGRRWPRRRRAGRRRGWPRASPPAVGLVEDSDAPRAGPAPSKSASSTTMAAPASASAARVGALVRRRRAGRAPRSAAARARRLGQRRRAGAAHEQVGGHQRVGHLVAQERHRPVALAQLGRQRLAPLERRRRSRRRRSRAGRPSALTSSGSASATASLRRRTACEPPKTSSTRHVRRAGPAGARELARVEAVERADGVPVR